VPLSFKCIGSVYYKFLATSYKVCETTKKESIEDPLSGDLRMMHSLEEVESCVRHRFYDYSCRLCETNSVPSKVVDREVTA